MVIMCGTNMNTAPRLNGDFDTPPLTSKQPVAYSANAIAVGHDTVTEASSYIWNGLKRGADPAHPFVIFQYTLAGCGEYRSVDGVKLIPKGTAIVAVIPSDHVYTLPKGQAQWTFEWLIVTHPYAVSRLIEAQAKTGPVIPVAPNDLLIARASSIYESVRDNNYRDFWALEQAVIEFAIEYDRFADRFLFPSGQREYLLEETRRIIIERIADSVDVVALADLHGLTRSHFSHKFKAVTGISPGQWIDQVRMDEGLRQLLESNLKLESLATLTGFANANHFCKVFRKRFHMSPAEYRRQMR